MENKFDVRKALITLIAIIGIISSTKLSVIYFNMNFLSNADPSFCTINEFIDCDGVAKTDYAHFFGIPLALYGLMFFGFVLVLNYSQRLKNIWLLKFLEVFKKPQSYIFSLSVIAVIISAILAYISTNEIHKICILCYLIYILNITLLFTSRGKETLFEHVKTSFNDFLDALSKPRYTVTAIVLAITASTAVYFLNSTNILAPQVKINEFRKAMEEFKTNKYKISGNILGDKDAKIVIHEYTDLQCGFCKLSNSMLHKLVSEVSNVKVIHHDYPIDKICNSAMTSDGHKNSCLYSQYGYAAKKQKKFWDFNTIVFENNRNLSEKKVLDYAKQVGLDLARLKKDAYSEKAKNTIIKEVDRANRMKIVATPSYRIGYEVYEGLMKYEELKELVIKAGAKPRVKDDTTK